VVSAEPVVAAGGTVAVVVTLPVVVSATVEVAAVVESAAVPVVPVSASAAAGMEVSAATATPQTTLRERRIRRILNDRATGIPLSGEFRRLPVARRRHLVRHPPSGTGE
jgi:hypothetical protein